MTVPNKGGRPKRTGPARIVVNARFTPELLAEVERWPGDLTLCAAFADERPDRHAKIMRLIRLGLNVAKTGHGYKRAVREPLKESGEPPK